MSLFQNTVTRRHLLSQGERIESALERFDELELRQFPAELKKQRNVFSHRQQNECKEYFTATKSNCESLAIDHTIDKMAYELYGLTEGESDDN